MKQLFTLIAFFAASLVGFSQNQIINVGFENWDNLGTSSEEPQGWNSFMTAENGGVSGFIFGIAQAQKIERSSDSRPGSSGNYSARIWSTSVVGNTANGNMTTGRVVVGSTTPTNPANHNITRTSDPNFHQDFTGLPDSLVVWVKYNASTGNQAKISATIHDNYDYRDPSGTDPNAPSHVVGKIEHLYSPTNGWQRLSIPFDYNHPASNAAFILMTFTTNGVPGGGSDGDEVFIDDIEFIYNPSVEINPSSNQNLVVNQNGNTLTATENFTASSREWKYKTSPTGSYQSFNPVQNAASYTPQFSSAGTYYIVCESSLNGDTYVSNQVMVTVSNFSSTVTPNTSQTIFQNQTGTILTVNESVSPDSREWKFSTTANGPYQSFSSPQINSSYTPLFFNTGTYYVVCESSKGGVTITSNEVEINVIQSSTPSISITPTTQQTIEINTDGVPLTANETISSSSREWKYSTTQGGPYQSFTPSINGTSYTPNFAIADTYYIMCESTMNGTLYTSNEVIIEVQDISVTIVPNTIQYLNAHLPGDTLFAVESIPATSRVWKYNNQLGAPYQTIPNQTDSFYIPRFEQTGFYYIICESNFNGVVKQSDLVTLIVNDGPNVTVSPAATQNINLGHSGNQLSVQADTFIIDSQEWKYSNSVNGPFMSFTTPEVLSNYLPNFTDTGVYYVICEAIIEGENFESNKVRINVEDTTISSLSSTEFSQYKIYAIDNFFNIDLTNQNFDNGLIMLSDIQGKLIGKHTLQPNEFNRFYLESNKGIIFYKVSIDKDIRLGKLLIK